MNDETLLALTKLAARLGTTAEHLWGVLVAQVPLGAVYTVVMAGVFAGPTAVLYRPCMTRYKSRRDAEEPSYDPPFFSLVPLITAGAALFLSAPYALYKVLTAIINPEFGALQVLIDLLE